METQVKNNEQDWEAELATRLTQEAAGQPVRLDIASLQRLVAALSAREEAPRPVVVLMDRYAVVSFPELSAQQFLVTKSLRRRVRAADFEGAPDAQVVGETATPASFASFAVDMLVRSGWWMLGGWSIIAWLIVFLADYAFASRLAELALTGSVVTYVLFRLLDRLRLPGELRDELIRSGLWQALCAHRRNLGKLIGVSGVVALLGVLFSHSTMAALQLEGYLEPATTAPARVLIVAGLTAGSVVLLAASLAGLGGLDDERRRVLVEQPAAASIAAGNQPRVGDS